MLASVLSKFGLPYQHSIIKPFGTGLINTTWKVETNSKEYILQRVNDKIFKDPFAIAHNVRIISDHLKKHYPGYHFLRPEKTTEGEDLVHLNEHGYFRLMPFIKNSHTVDVASNPCEAYEAAKQFGKFTKCLSSLDVSLLKITLPDFHNLSLRYQQFEDAVQNGNTNRITETKDAIEYLQKHAQIVDDFERLKTGLLKVRVTHHDTKISNVLFDDDNKGIYVIDLDTVMPGYFISDVGDMIRTYVSPANEEEKECSKIEIRKDFYEGIKSGYLSEMKDELTEEEKKHFLFAGKFMIYMQAIRFLTDYINDDIYYAIKYDGHNRVRAYNQIVLLDKLSAHEEELALI